MENNAAHQSTEHPEAAISGFDVPPIRVANDRLDGLISTLGLVLALALLGIYFSGIKLDVFLSQLTIWLSLFSTLYFGHSLYYRQPWWPNLIIGREGVICRHFSRKVIPWSSIEHISALELDTRRPNWRLDLRLRADANPMLLKRATKKSALFTHVPGKPNVSVSNIRFDGYSYLELSSLLNRCHQVFA